MRARTGLGRAATPVLLAAGLLGLVACGVPERYSTDRAALPAATVGPSATAPTSLAPAATPSVTPTPTPSPAGPPSQDRRFEKVTRITGAITPKSVVASSGGLVVAQNMIYTHTLTAYDTDHELVATVPDTIVPSEFGYDEWTKPVRGGPVEAAFSPDGAHVWVSNYSMYGPGFGSPGDDVCSPDSAIDDSFLYRIDTGSFEIDAAVLVGAVPKYVDATPDGRGVLVTNWCSWDLSLVDTTTLEVVGAVGIGRYPRGIAVSPDSSTAYVAVMGSSDLAVVDLDGLRAGGAKADIVSWFKGVGRGPRHLNLSPDGTTLYVTLNAEGKVAKVDARTGEVLEKVTTGNAPRSAVLSPDGTALFVVNYESDTVSRLRTSDMKVLESQPVDHHPIGITYNPVSQEIWVASYVGSITVFADAAA